MSEECIFCKIARGKIKSEFIYENASFFSVLDAKPIIKGHSLVISKQHFENILDMPDNLGSEFLDCVKETSLRVMKEFGCEGFNLVNNTNKVAGQVISHVHFHIIPRKKDDGLKVFV